VQPGSPQGLSTPLWCGQPVVHGGRESAQLVFYQNCKFLLAQNFRKIELKILVFIEIYKEFHAIL